MNAGRVSALAVDSRRGFGMQGFVCWYRYPHIIRGEVCWSYRISRFVLCTGILRCVLLYVYRLFWRQSGGFGATCSLISWSWIFLGANLCTTLVIYSLPSNQFWNSNFA